MFRIPEVCVNIGRRSCWLILTVSPSELMDVNFSFALPYLTVDYVLCPFFPTPKFSLRFMRTRAPLAKYKRQSVLAALILVALLPPTVLLDDHRFQWKLYHSVTVPVIRRGVSWAEGLSFSVDLRPFSPLAAGSASIPSRPSTSCFLKCQLVRLYTDSTFLKLPAFFFPSYPLNAERPMSFSGASPSLCHSQGDRVYGAADTARCRALVQYRFALQRGWHERQVSEVEIFDRDGRR